MDTTSIIYYTDNTLNPEIMEICQRNIREAAEGKPIISVSQKPISFGNNICVGEIGRSHISLFSQSLIGAKNAHTKYIALAEHDILYAPEHFNWIPTDDTIFWYNINVWFLQWSGSNLDGMYSYFRRKCMSQLICERTIFIRAIEEKLEMLKMGAEIRKGQPGACEPGVCDNRKAFVEAKAELAKIKDVGKNPPWQAKAFRTTIPNIDIRHGSNFSGNRRANKRRWILPYWVGLSDIRMKYQHDEIYA